MTLEEANNSIGRKVVFEQFGCKKEEGVITSVNDRFIFVRFGNSCQGQACSPSSISLIGGVKNGKN